MSDGDATRKRIHEAKHCLGNVEEIERNMQVHGWYKKGEAKTLLKYWKDKLANMGFIV